MASQFKFGDMPEWKAILRRDNATSDHSRRANIVKSTPPSTSPTSRSARTAQAGNRGSLQPWPIPNINNKLPLRVSATPDPPTSKVSATPLDSVVMAVDFDTGAQIDPSLQSLTQFMSANLIQQKRLKANHSQITMVTLQFIDLKAKYKPSFTTPPSTTFAIRVRMYEELGRFCTRYDNLLELRRQILQKQLAWLEAALDAPVLADSMQLCLAIEMQIEIAKELAEIQKEAKLKRALEALWQSG